MSDAHRARILVIDDEPKVANVVRLVLATEHAVVALTSGQDALDRIEAGERFDLILCDLTMPGVTGMDFYGRVGRIAPELVERIVFATGGAHMPGAEVFLRQTGIRWIEKPIGLVELRSAVRAHLARLSSAPPVR